MASLAFAGSAAAAVVPLTAHCGQVLTGRATYVLQNDVGPCSTDGIVIKNPGRGATLTLDLNGHTISGQPLETDADGTPTGGLGEGAGVRVLGSNGVVVRNGTIRDFDSGVLLVRSKTKPTTNSKVTELQLVENVGNLAEPPEGALSDFSAGVSLLGATGNLVERNRFTDNGVGIHLIDAANDNQMKDNQVTGNRSTGISMISFNERNVIDGNAIEGNRGSGINLAFDDPNNVIQNNTVDSNRGTGIRTSVDSSSNTIHKNTVTNNGLTGIVPRSEENTVTENTVTGNGTRGLVDSGSADGITVSGGFLDDDPIFGNRVEANVVQNNAGNGIQITCTRNFTDFPDAPPCSGFNQNNRILNNEVTGNGGARAGTQVFGSGFNAGFLVGVYDLLDGNNSVNPQDPDNPTTDCDSNTWSGNTFNTAFPNCTTG